jgi:hypothetical protein
VVAARLEGKDLYTSLPMPLITVIKERSEETRKVSRFQFPQQAKFAFVAFTNVYTDIVNEQQLSDGTWVFHRFPVEVDNSWREWLGTIGVQELERSNLFIMSSEASSLPHVLDEHHEKLKRKVAHIFSALQMLEGLEYSGGVSA